ncbi:MAG TPA: hypothetical protein VNO79_10020 [Actinomycetota bacterium]|nr:hypothetical protein [Actinomycetota bacterium]
MRRGSSTVVVLVGEVDEALLAEVDRPANVTVVRADDPGVEAAISALAEASGRQAPFVLVAGDPLAAVAEGWRTAWRPGEAGTAAFEEAAGEALLAWRAGRFELPDYYLVVAREPAGGDAEPPSPHPDDFHLGVLRTERPSRVVAVPAGEARVAALRVLRALRRLPVGPWWPPLDRLVEAARTFFPGRLAS